MLKNQYNMGTFRFMWAIFIIALEWTQKKKK